jgi:hypothetical protein
MFETLVVVAPPCITGHLPSLIADLSSKIGEPFGIEPGVTPEKPRHREFMSSHHQATLGQVTSGVNSLE